MKMDTESATIIRSEDFAEINFQIGDPILIMEILRKNMYSNPIKSICQEIMANARDAHVEVGNEEVPIKVTLPTKEEPVWICQDFGPGINPKRMIDVYSRFGCSTKRNTNNQVGGFGLGSKVIFAYTDSCLITTICNIEGHHIKFQYTAIIGETKALKLIQLQEPMGTEEPCGTTISINVARNDVQSFISYTYQVTGYWNVKPTFIHPDEHNKYNKTGLFVYEDGDFRIASRNHPFCDSPVILIDKVPYSIDNNIFRGLLKNEEWIFFFRSPCVLEFGNGELSISSNRETLYFDDKTKASTLDFYDKTKNQTVSTQFLTYNFPNTNIICDKNAKSMNVKTRLVTSQCSKAGVESGGLDASDNCILFERKNKPNITCNYSSAFKAGNPLTKLTYGSNEVPV